MIQNYRHALRALSSRFDFCQEFLRQPRQVASVMASSRFLEKRLVEVAEVSSSSFLVELGPGTGGTTRALLEAAHQRTMLLAIELIPSLASQLANIGDPRLLVEEADALELSDILDRRGLPQPDRIISGIPFSSLKPEAAHHLMGQIRDVLAPGGCFVAYQFRRAIVPLASSCFGPAEVFREYRNFPPLWIYRWRKDKGDDLHPGGIRPVPIRRDCATEGLDRTSRENDCRNERRAVV